MKPFKTSILSGALFTFVAASATVATTSSYAVPAYDGLWSVSIVTEKGDCDRGYRYPIRIQNGALANAGSVTAVTINGKVQPTGAITVTVCETVPSWSSKWSMGAVPEWMVRVCCSVSNPVWVMVTA